MDSDKRDLGGGVLLGSSNGLFLDLFLNWLH